MPGLKTVPRDSNPSDKTQRNQRTEKKRIKVNKKLQNIQLRYSHIPITKYNRNTLYKPRPIPFTKKTKVPIKPSGNSWNLLIEELKKTSPKSHRKNNPSLKPLRPFLRKTERVLKHRPTTINENIHALEKELNKNNKKNTVPIYYPKGTKI